MANSKRSVRIKKVAQTLAAAAAFVFASAAQAETVYVTADRMLDVQQGRYVAAPLLTVVDGRVSKVESGGSAPASAEVIDLDGFTILPGLIDMHVHLDGRPEIRGYSALAYSDRFWLAIAAANARWMLGAGFTTVVRDLVDLLAALDEDGLIDADRAAVAGGSYGGYMVNAVLAAYPEAFKAGVSLYGAADWVTGLEVASPALKASDRIEYGDISDPRWREFYQENSPIRQAARTVVPVLYRTG